MGFLEAKPGWPSESGPGPLTDCLRHLPSEPQGCSLSLRIPALPGAWVLPALLLTRGCDFSKGTAATPAAPLEAAKQAAFVVWARATVGSSTKGGKKGANPLRTRCALSHWDPSAPGEPGRAGAWPRRRKQAKAARE